MIFIKPSTSYNETSQFQLPSVSGRVDHEAEIVIKIKHSLKGNISDKEAGLAISGWAIGIDFTARDLQEEAKKKGQPWSLSKGLPGFATVGRFVDCVSLPLSFELSLNGTLKQKGSSSDMIFSPIQIIQYLASTFTLEAGDLIFTGTPEGVGVVGSGDRIEAKLEGYESHINLRVS
jgi:2-keto-4-pentenoate hydratase/2-oxohepta-3-ene-1,7-dioic acid hydratase in catechol pathway